MVVVAAARGGGAGRARGRGRGAGRDDGAADDDAAAALIGLAAATNREPARPVIWRYKEQEQVALPGDRVEVENLGFGTLRWKRNDWQLGQQLIIKFDGFDKYEECMCRGVRALNNRAVPK